MILQLSLKKSACYTYEFSNGLVQTSLEAGSELGDYEILPFVATISAARNAHNWWTGQQSLEEAAFNVAIESASKGIMAVAGGFAGTGLGMLLFGPAGAYVFGGVVAVAATTESKRIVDRADTFLDPERDHNLYDAANTLLSTCLEHLEAKVSAIKCKSASLPNGEIADEMRHRWQWELVFVKSKINETIRLLQSSNYSGERKSIAALELACQSGIHPAQLQSSYIELLGQLSNHIDRPAKTKDIARVGLGKVIKLGKNIRERYPKQR